MLAERAVIASSVERARTASVTTSEPRPVNQTVVATRREDGDRPPRLDRDVAWQQRPAAARRRPPEAARPRGAV